MLSKRLTLPLFVAAVAGCAPTVTIADGTSGAGGEGDAASGGNAASGGMSGGSSSGGSMSSGGSSGGPGGSPNGGSPSAIGGTSSGGSAGGSGLPASCAQPIEGYLANFTCDVSTPLRQHCAKSGCHNAATAAGRLNLVADDFLIARILNVQATFHQSGHTAPNQTPCLAGGCPTQALLLDRSSPEDSWMLRKMEPFVPGETLESLDMGCGYAMPTFQTAGTERYDSASKACLIQFFTRLAIEGEPCAPAVTEPPERPPLCPEDG